MKQQILLLVLCMMLPMTTLLGQRINDLVCINAKVFDPVTPLKRFSYARVYHEWSDDMGNSIHYGDNPNTSEVECMDLNDGNLGRCLDLDKPCEWRFGWNPSYNQSGPFLRYDDYYKSLNGRCIPVLKGITQHFRGYTSYPWDPRWMEQKPTCPISPTQFSLASPQDAVTFLAQLPSAADQNLPATWSGHALWMSDFAAKFGVGTLSASFLAQYMHPDQGLPIINTPFIEYIEDNNETNKNWLEQPLLGISPTGSDGVTISQDFEDGNTAIYFSPSQYGAMFKADVNGNNDVMTYSSSPTRTLGIVNNSNIGIDHIAMAGTTGLNGAYANDVQIAFGNSNFIANFHHYCTEKTAEQSATGFLSGEFANHHLILTGDHGVCPEADVLREKLIALRGGIDGSYPEVWLSEFGYDSWETPGNSFTNADPIDGPDGHYDAQKVQAQWLTRGVLETAASQSIDKLMLYEIRDDQTVGGTYRFSGLTSFSGGNKRSWYYIMTLKKILGEYTFEKILENGVDDYEIKTDPVDEKVRVYQFGKGPNLVDKMFVVWSPTMEAREKYECSITFPISAFDLSLTGSGILYRIQEFSEVGKAEVLYDVVGQKVTVTDVSETPLFFKLGPGVVRTPPDHVSNLSCAATCCGSVTLYWKNPGHTKNHLIYYYELQSGETTCPPFDPIRYHLFANTIGAFRSSYTVSGLNNGKEYCFVVLPVNLYGLVPVDPENAPTTKCTTNAGACNNCFIQITAAEVSFSPQYSQDPTNLAIITNQAEYVLGISGAPVTCSTLTQECNQNLVVWNEWITPSPSFPDPNTIYIHFTKPKFLNTIFFQDWNGNGQVLIEYKKCNCNLWFKLSKVDFIGDFDCFDDQNPNTPFPTAPLRILGNIPGIQITDLKITRLHPQLQVGHIAFCGKDTECREPQHSDGSVTPEITADEIRENSAMLNWTAIPVEENEEFVEMASEYQLRISQFKDGSGELVNPTVIPIEAEILDYDHYSRLTGLAPGTTYYTEIIPVPTPDCAVIYATPAGHKTQFTTLSAEGPGSPGGGRDVPEQKKARTDAQPIAFSVRLQPNPATDIAQISVSEGGIGFVTIMDNLGKTLKTQSGNQAAQMELKLDGLPKGHYWLRVQNISGSVATVAFAKM